MTSQLLEAAKLLEKKASFLQGCQALQELIPSLSQDLENPAILSKTLQRARTLLTSRYCSRFPMHTYEAYKSLSLSLSLCVCVSLSLLHTHTHNFSNMHTLLLHNCARTHTHTHARMHGRKHTSSTVEKQQGLPVPCSPQIYQPFFLESSTRAFQGSCSR